MMRLLGLANDDAHCWDRSRLAPFSPPGFERKLADTPARCCEQCVGHRRRNRGSSRFADTAPSRSARRYQLDFDLRRVGEADDLVVVEIALFHSPVTDRDLAAERRVETVDDATLDLRYRGIGVDHVAAIDGSNDAIDAQLPGLRNRYLCDLGDDRVVAFMKGQTATATPR